jgi:hypothetical protein
VHVRAALIALLAGCGGPSPLPALPRVTGAPRPIEEASALLDRIRTREEEVATWKAVLSLAIEDRANDRSGSLRGALLVRRPDRFRLRLLGPAGVTAMDLLYVAPRYRLVVPGRPPIEGADAAREKRLPVGAMARAFLRQYDAPARSLVVGGGRSRLELSDRSVFLTASEDVLVDSIRENGKESVRVTYADYRDVTGHRLPFRVRMDLPERELTARVDVERYEVDPAIPQEAFQ